MSACDCSCAEFCYSHPCWQGDYAREMACVAHMACARSATVFHRDGGAASVWGSGLGMFWGVMCVMCVHVCPLAQQMGLRVRGGDVLGGHVPLRTTDGAARARLGLARLRLGLVPPPNARRARCIPVGPGGPHATAT